MKYRICARLNTLVKPSDDASRVLRNASIYSSIAAISLVSVMAQADVPVIPDDKSWRQSPKEEVDAPILPPPPKPGYTIENFSLADGTKEQLIVFPGSRVQRIVTDSHGTVLHSSVIRGQNKPNESR